MCICHFVLHVAVECLLYYIIRSLFFIPSTLSIYL